MTVSSELNRKTFAGDAVTTSFGTSPVVFFDTSDLVVFVVDSSGAVTDLVENTDYTVSGGAGSTGTLDLSAGSAPHGAVAAGSTLVIVRTLALVQEVDFVQNDSSDAEVAEDALDKVTMMLQQLNARIERSFVLADSDVSGASTELPTPAATTLLGWDGAGTALQNYSAETLDQALTTPFTLTLLDDPDANSFAQTLVAGLSAETAPAVDDVVLIGDTSESKGNKMTLANALKVIDALTADTAPDVADEVVTYDASATAAKKVTLQNALKIVNGLTEDTAPDQSADFVLSYDASAAAPKKVKLNAVNSLTLGAEQSTATGTAFDFTGIPAGVRGFFVQFAGVSLGTADNFLIQLGISTGVVTSGYASGGFRVVPTGSAGLSTAGILFPNQTLVAFSGNIIGTLKDSTNNEWVVSGVLGRVASSGDVIGGGGHITSLGGVLDRVRITTAGGSGFTAGSVSVAYFF